MPNRRQLLAMPVLLAGAARIASPGSGRAQTPTPGPESWPRASLADLGFDPGLGDSLIAALPGFPAVTGVCVVRSGQLAFEHYVNGYDAQTVVNIRSVTKSITSTLVGIALQCGDLTSIDVTVAESVPNRIS
jgi:CubicO group peptidase (beta-lactamase class C family)